MKSPMILLLRRGVPQKPNPGDLLENTIDGWGKESCGRSRMPRLGPFRSTSADQLAVSIIADSEQIMSSGGKTMIKAGDMLKKIESGKVFMVKSTSPRIILLVTQDGSHSMFVSPDSIESTFVPFVEDGARRNLKS